ncbi:MAG: carbamate kinase [Deltaproteobacteria bacterium]|jgi:carbamate kinase|nr:carbamate kinase [Deltaproteobacteria bacterium]
MHSKLAIIAVGGNSLISDQKKITVEEQYKAIQKTVRHIADIIEDGYQVCVTHGNGPQVGFIMRRSEIARKVAAMHPVPLASCVADTQGALGWQIQQVLSNELSKRGITGNRGLAVSVVTQVLVDKDDSAFGAPDKFVGEFFKEEDLPTLRMNYPHWVIHQDSGRGWRRVVPSPKPMKIIELSAIRTLLANDFNVVAVGGGGVPVLRKKNGDLGGIAAVIDKDLATCLLAVELGAPLLIISTAVDKVCLNFGKPDQQNLDCVKAAAMREFYQAGHFPPGSMGPKIKSALEFLEQGGKEVIITSPENLKKALQVNHGTHIVP